MTELRWILLAVGLLILAGIYWFADPSQRGKAAEKPRPKPGARSGGDGSPLDDEVPDEAMERELERLGELISEERQADPLAEGAASSSDPVLNTEPEKIVALFLKPPTGGRLPGAQIRRAAEQVGMSFGAMGIFHRLQEVGEDTVAIYSLADMMSPGSFDPQTLDASSTAGLCLFLTLPNPLSALDAWDAMFASGQRLADLLEADLLDESQSSISRQRIAHIREEMREYDRRSEFSLPR